MAGDFIRSTLFNVCFYLLTAGACIVLLPTLFLPRKYYMAVVQGFVGGVYFLERTLLGLKLEVRGGENLPESGAYIVAAKHQSAYETFKLHLLFKDPAIILKQELLRIPLWGLYLSKSDPIAIDRSDPKGANHSIQEGAKRIAAERRPIIIFPQGTRVSPEQTSADKPYRMGVARVQEATDLPIIPLAMNSGIFWPKHHWVKRKGSVVFSFLPPIKAEGQTKDAVIKLLEEQIESESLSLINEAREKLAARDEHLSKMLLVTIAVIVALLFGVYSFAWFKVAERTKIEYVTMLENITGGHDIYNPPEITGYPLKMRIYVAEEQVQTDRGTVFIKDLSAKGWPFPFTPIEIKSGPVSIQYFRWKEPVLFDRLDATISLETTRVNIHTSALYQGDFMAHLAGAIDMKAEPAPFIDLLATLENPTSFMNNLAKSGVLKDRMAMLVAGALESLKDKDGLTTVTLQQKNMALMVGPLPIYYFPQAQEYDPVQDARLPLTQ